MAIFSYSFWRTLGVLGFSIEHLAINTAICHFHRANHDKTTTFWLLLSSLGMIITDPTRIWTNTHHINEMPPSLPIFPGVCWLFSCFGASKKSPFLMETKWALYIESLVSGSASNAELEGGRSHRSRRLRPTARPSCFSVGGWMVFGST